MGDGTWDHGLNYSIKVIIELKTPESAVDISYLDFDYDTRYEYTTLLPIINFTSTTTSLTQTDGITTLNEPLKVEKILMVIVMDLMEQLQMYQS